MPSEDQPPNERNEPDMSAHKDCRCSPDYGGRICEPCQIRFHVKRHAAKDAEIESLRSSNADIIRSADKWYERYREQELALAEKDARIAELEAEVAKLRGRIDALLADADFDATAEDYPSDPPVTRKELAAVLLSMHSMSHNTLVSGYERQIIGPVNIDMLRRLERGEDARGEG